MGTLVSRECPYLIFVYSPFKLKEVPGAGEDDDPPKRPWEGCVGEENIEAGPDLINNYPQPVYGACTKFLLWKMCVREAQNWFIPPELGKFLVF